MALNEKNIKNSFLKNFHTIIHYQYSLWIIKVIICFNQKNVLLNFDIFKKKQQYQSNFSF